ncbi:digestive organ expansion factor [Amanita muscaria]
MDEANIIATRLLTLLNVSATRIGKRKRPYEEDDISTQEKLNKRKSIQFADAEPVVSNSPSETRVVVKNVQEGATAQVPEDIVEGVDEAEGRGLYERHFGTRPTVLTESARLAVNRKAWVASKEIYGKLGSALVEIPEGAEDPITKHTSENDATPFLSRRSKQSADRNEYQSDLLSLLSTRRDLYLASSSLDLRKCIREAVSLHALNHILKKRRRILKNNKRLAHAAKTNPDPPPEDVQDQGFTRPSVLILLPFRSSALDWFTAMTSHTPLPAYQIENQSRFLTEYGLPAGAVDKLTTAEPGTYPRDHVETFKGNVDDNFRVGLKMTRKSVKMFSEFYGSDAIIASPLGLRRSIEKEKGADYLSSIEILIVDQMEALTMQNWDHVKFVLSYLNQLPKESHNTDFSRVKSWHLDGHVIYLRQSILISAYETPETRSFYNSALKNVAGRIRTEKRWPPVEVPEGIEQVNHFPLLFLTGLIACPQNFIHFDCSNPKDEVNKRFHHFTTQVLPSVFKSAVQSTNTAIFVPSSFDFIRIQNYFRKHAGVSFIVLSEYSTNQDIARARLAFFEGKKSFLLISERFHFYRRQVQHLYKIRGVRNLIFYGPPDHPQFITELLSYPFLDDGVEPSDVTCRILYCKYDWFRLERIAGTDAAAGLIKGT